MCIRDRYFDDELKSQNLSEDEWVSKLKFSLLEKKIFTSIKSKIAPPTDSELNQFYNTHMEEFKTHEKIKIRQIITGSELKADKAIAALRNKYSFISTYRRYSQEYTRFNQPQTAWIDIKKTSPFNNLSNLKKGSYSPIFKSDLGYHIAQLLDRKKEQQLSFKEAKNIVKQRYNERFQKEKLIAWLKNELGSKKIFLNQELINNVRFEQRVNND